MSEADYPRVGVATLVVRDGRLLLGRRRKSPGMNTWQCPGGLLEKNESVFECARRETLEETGLTIHNLHYGPYTNNRFAEAGEHTVTLYVAAAYLGGELQKLEADRADEWQWCDLQQLPRPLFLPLETLLQKHADWLDSVVGIVK
jgi:8-oxo-dGTP diphosphatase